MTTDNGESRRRIDKHNVYLPYLRELGAMAILALVLYGVWDVGKNEGRAAITAIEQQTSAIRSLTAVNSKILDHLKRVEANRNAYSNPGVFGPNNPYGRDRNP